MFDFSQNHHTPRKLYGPRSCSSHAHAYASRTPAGFLSGTHKNLQPCRLPNLFSCQISSSSAFADYPPRRGLGCFQPNVRRQATFLNRDTQSVVVLTPNIELGVCRSSLVVGQPRAANGCFSGGADRDRTGGLLVANQALSQLSYSPNPVVCLWSLAKPANDERLATND